jgi:hypothetical protein
MAPSESLPLNRRLSNHHDFLSVLIFLMDCQEIVHRKEWSSAIEQWVFRQIEKGSKAHTAFHNHLKTAHGFFQPSADVCYFRCFLDFKEALIEYFFTKLKDPIQVIEDSLTRIKLSLSGSDGPTTPTTLEGFCNTLRFLFDQAPTADPYSERQQVARIRKRLPKQVEAYLGEWEIDNNKRIDNFVSLMPCLHRQDVLHSDSLELKNHQNTSNKRPSTSDASLRGAEVMDGTKNAKSLTTAPFALIVISPGTSLIIVGASIPTKREHSTTRGVVLPSPLSLSTMFLPSPSKQCSLKLLIACFLRPLKRLDNFGD